MKMVSEVPSLADWGSVLLFCSVRCFKWRGEHVWTLEGQEVSDKLVVGDGEWELKAMSWLTQSFPGSLG